MKKFIMFFSLVILISLVTFAQQEWQWVSPIPGGGNFDVSFFDANNGIIVGGSGTIHITTNGGESWKWVPHLTTVHLSSVSFLDANTATAVGGGGTIIRTNDGGNTWITQVSGTSVHLLKVHFIDINNGIAVGQSGKILKTTNGGSTWATQTSGTSVHLYGVHFSDSNNGTVVGASGVILRTTNGGDSWFSKTSGTTNTLYGVYFTDINTGTVVGRFGTILRTTDGGDTFESQTGSSNNLWDVYFTNLNEGIILGVGGSDFVLKTTNGGATWVQKLTGTENAKNFSFVDMNTGYVVGSELGVNGFFSDELFKTTDGGETWINLRTSFGFEEITGVTLINATTFCIIDNSLDFKRFHKTTDGGLTWFTYSFSTSFTLNDIYFNDTENGIVIGTGGAIYHTTNGGTSWVTRTSGTTASFNAVSFSDALNGTIVGDAGTIRRTTDGGTTWNHQTSGTINQLTGVYFIDADVGTAVGASGTIIKTTDGGTTWFSQSSSTSKTLNDVSFSDANNGIIVASEITLRTTNGGADWITTFIYEIPDLSAIIQTDGINASAVSFGGKIFETSNGGIDWEQRVIVYPGFYDIAILSSGEKIAVGSYGAILTTIDSSIPVNMIPVFIAPTPECGSTINVDVGSPVNFTIAAEDGDAGDVVTLTSSSLPFGSLMSPGLPTDGNPISSDFSWTPDLSSVGIHTVTFEITDNNSAPFSCSFNIEIVNNNVAPIFIAPTPECGSTINVDIGSPVNFTIAAEDGDAGDVVTLTVIGLPSGSSMDPALPAAGNLVSSTFSWTPTSSDAGTYEIIYTATDNFTASAFCTLTVNVEGVPAVVCPLNQLYWEANPSSWLLSSMVLGTVNNYTNTELLSILRSTVRSDASIILAKQLIAAKLNVANGAPVPTAVANAITNADNTIGTKMIPANIRIISRTGFTMLIQAIYLWSYNNNFLTPDCVSTLLKRMAMEEEISMPVNEYSLFDNYPNPFNPTTKIMYTVPNNENVTLKVFNTIGEEVMTLVNEVKQPGLYEVEFNSDGLPSGVYLYRITAGDFVATKKMILMK